MKSPFGFSALFRILSPAFLKLCYRLFTDKRVPFGGKLLVLAAVGYLVLPLDFFPDWTVPFLAYADDFLVLAVVLQMFVRMAPRHVVQEHMLLIQWERYSRNR